MAGSTPVGSRNGRGRAAIEISRFAAQPCFMDTEASPFGAGRCLSDPGEIPFLDTVHIVGDISDSKHSSAWERSGQRYGGDRRS